MRCTSDLIREQVSMRGGVVEIPAMYNERIKRNECRRLPKHAPSSLPPSSARCSPDNLTMLSAVHLSSVMLEFVGAGELNMHLACREFRLAERTLQQLVWRLYQLCMQDSAIAAAEPRFPRLWPFLRCHPVKTCSRLRPSP